MENSTYILVPSGGGQQLQIPVAGSSASKPNGGHVVVSAGDSAHTAPNLTAGKSVLNVRTVGANFAAAAARRPGGDAASHPTNAQTHPVRFVVANKDGFVSVPNFASLSSTGGLQAAAATAAPANTRVMFVKQPSGGNVQKIAPAATGGANFSALVPNGGSLRSAIPIGANKVAGRTVPVAAGSFSNSVATVVPKTAGTLWGSVSVPNCSVAGSNSTHATSPSKPVIIQIDPEQLSLLTGGSVGQAAAVGGATVSNPGLGNSSTPVAPSYSYYTTVGYSVNNNNNGAPQFVRVVTSNTPIQPKLLPSTHLVATSAHTVTNNTKPGLSAVRSVGGLTQMPPATTQRMILPAVPSVYPSIAPSNVYKIETQVASGGAQPVAFIGQPGFSFQPIAKSQAPVQRSRLSLDSSLGVGHVDGLAQTSRLRSWTPEAPSRPRKPCNCNKSQCLKLYCECFANGEFCSDCNCCNCYNNLLHEDERSRAVKACLDRNPHAFHPKIGKGGNVRQHCKGCNCKRSGCLKNYCECYEAKIPCSRLCRCVGCKNIEDSADRQNLLHLADAAEVRVQQQAAAETKLAGQIVAPPVRPAPLPSGAERPAYSFLTLDVIEAMCSCLLAEAENGEQTRRSSFDQEQRIMSEFGRCLHQVIDSASRTRAPTPMDQ